MARRKSRGASGWLFGGGGAQVLAAAYQALSTRGLAGDMRAERALVQLLTLPITKYDVVTGLGLSE